MTSIRFTSRDLEVLPLEDGKRYEIIDGELYVFRQPHGYHQLVCNHIGKALGNWSDDGDLGLVFQAPGLIFAEDDVVAPDVIWVSRARLPVIFETDGKFHAAPDLVVEVLSSGPANERRDRQVKLELYSRRGVPEYWIVDWLRKQVYVYRREQADLRLATTLRESDTLTSPLLPGFSCQVAALFFRVGLI